MADAAVASALATKDAQRSAAAAVAAAEVRLPAHKVFAFEEPTPASTHHPAAGSSSWCAGNGAARGGDGDDAAGTNEAADGGEPRRARQGLSPAVPLNRLSRGASGAPPVDLPDLTSRIVSLGLYQEYCNFREGYLNWRQGSHRGARGEHTAHGLMQTTARGALELWFPTFAVWQWRRTIAYWIAVTFVEGSLLFTVAGVCGTTRPSQFGEYRAAVTVWPTVVGSVFYLLGAYLMCIETINLNRPLMRYWPFAFCSVRDSMRRFGGDVTLLPYLISVSYFIGACFYVLASLSELVEGRSPVVALVTSIVPEIIGGLFFIVGGTCECLDNNVFTRKPVTMSWWVASFNLVGGLLFTASAVSLFWSDFWSYAFSAVGSGFFLVASALNVLMWKDEQYGLTFLSAMNRFGTGYERNPPIMSADTPGDAITEDGGSSHGRVSDMRRFSWRGVLFLYFYCFVADASVYNFCTELQRSLAGPNLHSLTLIYNEALPFILLHMVLVMHSAVVQTPNSQPYHFLVMSTRFMALVTGAVSLVSFCLRIHKTSHAPDALELGDHGLVLQDLLGAPSQLITEQRAFV